jgi:anti-sigma B factor antagonist
MRTRQETHSGLLTTPQARSFTTPSSPAPSTFAGADVQTFALEGEIGEAELNAVLQAMFRAAIRGCQRVLLDFSEVSHFDYRGVRQLVARAERFRKAGGDLKLCGLSPYVHAIFRSVGAHDAFEYFERADQARAAF